MRLHCQQHGWCQWLWLVSVGREGGDGTGLHNPSHFCHKIVKKWHSAQINALASMASRTSMWIALLHRHVKTSPQRLELTAPLNFLVWIVHGPKTSKPTFVNGGAVSVLSVGRSAMCCVTISPLDFLHVTQVLIIFATIPWPPMTQYPA